MRVQQVEYKNLFSMGHVQLELDPNQVTLITGYSNDEGSSNGSGKSSLANKGLVWTLYGQTPHGFKADHVVNRHTGKKRAWGRVTVEGVDGESYTIYRQRGPAKLTLTRGDEDVSSRKSAETQEMIDKILGRDFKSFIQTEFFGQGRTLSYASLPPAEMKAVLENILPMEQVDEWAERAKEARKEIKDLLKEEESGLLTVRGELATLQQSQDMAEGSSKQWEDDKKWQIDSFKEQIAKEDERLSGTDAERARLQEELAAVGDLMTPEDYKTVVDKSTSIRAEYEEANQQKTKADESAKAWIAREELCTQKLLRKWDPVVCIQCKQPLPNLDELKKGFEKEQEEFTIRLQEAEFNRRKASEAQLHWYAALDVLLAQQTSLTQILQAEQAKISVLQRVKDQLEKIGEVEDNRPKLRVQLEELEKTENPHVDSIIVYKDRVESCTAKMVTLVKRVESLQEELDHLEFWHDKYAKDVKIKLFEEACPFLDMRTQHHLQALGNPQIHAVFSTIKVLESGETREEFGVRVWSETGGDGFALLSGGEQQMVSFAIGRALADLARTQVAGDSYIQILDEPFSMLDERNSENIVRYLNEELKGGTILLISNEEHLKSLVPNRVHVTKTKGITEVTEGDA